MADATMIATSENLGKPLPVRLSRIERFEGQPRKFFNLVSLQELANSIELEGQQQPVKLCTKPGCAGHFILIDGERRLRAFQIIQKRTGVEPLVDAFIDVVKDLKDHFRRSVVANLQREDLSPLDEADALSQLRHQGDTIESLARLRGRSTTYIDGYLKLHTLPDQVKVLMDPSRPKETQLTVTQAIDIARGIPESDPALRVTVAQEAVERGMGVVETRSLVDYRSGTGGYRAGGKFRSPSDDYKVFASFLSRTIITANRLQTTLNIYGLYVHRLDDKEDREKDLKAIDDIIETLQKIRKEVIE